jgi:nucleotide-binding universal stress UspA family protein
MKILLAVDGSDYTRKMVEFVSSQSLFGERHEYTVFNSQPPLPPHAAAAVGGAAARDYHEEEAQKVVGPVLATLRQHGLTVSATWKTGPVGETIAGFARDGGFDLLVMGTHGYGALRRLVTGSVTTQVLARSTVPVLLVP